VGITFLDMGLHCTLAQVIKDTVIVDTLNPFKQCLWVGMPDVA